MSVCVRRRTDLAFRNLQSANHVLFVTPYLTDTNEDYATCMQQAIGRAVRPGQLKTVNVYRFVTLNTIDVDILAQRERRASPLAMTEAMDVRAESVRSSAAEKESVVLVEDVAGRFAMVPESWLSSKGRLFKAAQKSHTSLTMFSEKFAGE